MLQRTGSGGSLWILQNVVCPNVAPDDMDITRMWGGTIRECRSPIVSPRHFIDAGEAPYTFDAQPLAEPAVSFEIGDHLLNRCGK